MTHLCSGHAQQLIESKTSTILYMSSLLQFYFISAWKWNAKSIFIFRGYILLVVFVIIHIIKIFTETLQLLKKTAETICKVENCNMKIQPYIPKSSIPDS